MAACWKGSKHSRGSKLSTRVFWDTWVASFALSLKNLTNHCSDKTHHMHIITYCPAHISQVWPTEYLNRNIDIFSTRSRTGTTQLY